MASLNSFASIFIAAWRAGRKGDPMSVWSIAPIELRPDVTLESLAVFEVPLNGTDQPWTRHLAGHSLEDGQGQVCSPVESFDPATGQFVTRSGRVYLVRGRPGLGPDAEYVWRRWKHISDVAEERDVTKEVLSELQAGQTKGGRKRRPRYSAPAP